MLCSLEQASKVDISCSSSALGKMHAVLKRSGLLEHCHFPLYQVVSFISSCQRTSVFHPYPFFWRPDLTFTTPSETQFERPFFHHFCVGELFHNSFLSLCSFVPLIFFGYKSTRVEAYHLIKYIMLYILSQYDISLNLLRTAAQLLVFLEKYLDNN